jgi:Mce-associated membrane protein
VRRLTALAVTAVILIAAAVLLAIANHSARVNGPLANEAFVDTGATSAVKAEMTAAIKTVYSYDYRTLDANRADATAVITGQFSQEFDKVFDAVKQLAPKEQAVMTTAVPAAGVLQLRDDRARLLMMVDQNGTKAGAQPIGGASARLVVEAQLVDGHWKIAEVTPE